MEVAHKLIRFALKPPREQLRTVRSRLVETDWYWKIRSPGNDRTAYIIGLFGTGRWYVIELMKHIGERAKYFRVGIRLHTVPTSMIYSGHTTMRYACRLQELPGVTSRILEAVRSRFADLIFVYRHPLDSLLTNWVWWRTHLRHNVGLTVTMVYKNTDDLCVDLERSFSEFKAFADGDPRFFPDPIGGRFLSFAEFVEETELFVQAATLALRLEDFVIDPVREFSKIVRVMSVDLDVNRLQVPPPKTKPYRYLAVREKVPRFREFVNELDAETKRRIERVGYKVGG